MIEIGFVGFVLLIAIGVAIGIPIGLKLHNRENHGR